MLKALEPKLTSMSLVQDADGSVPFFWGTDAEGDLVVSNDGEVVKKGCGKSFAPFPKGIILFLEVSCSLPV